MKIIDIKPSPRYNKRFRVLLDNGKTYDFGLKNGKTYIDHHDEKLRLNYTKRHLALKKENPFITELIPSPALFSYYLLWGSNKDIYDNIDNLNELLKKNE